jgi:hypothetical protein
MADEEEALEDALHARLLGDSQLFREARDRVDAARARAARARSERFARLGEVPGDRASDTDPLDFELEQLLRDANGELDQAQLPPFERALAAQAGVQVEPPATEELQAGEFLFRLVSVSESEVEIFVSSNNERFSGQVLMFTVVGEPQATSYAITLYSEASGLTVGYVLIRTLEESVSIRGIRLLLSSALGADHIDAISRSFERLPPEAVDAWRAIARARAPEDPVREVIDGALGDI